MSKITNIQGTFTLHNGVEMPYLGLGVYLSKDGQEVTNAVKWALDAGYRHVDTASIYNNEEGVGAGMGGHEGSFRQGLHVPESFFVQVREVHHDPQAVAGFNQLPAGISQAGARVG